MIKKIVLDMIQALKTLYDKFIKFMNRDILNEETR
jgi:hypothetical protein